jgi:hypothetical protein
MLGHSCGNIWHDIFVNVLAVFTTGLPFIPLVYVVRSFFRKPKSRCGHESH